ncbi:hypothetical protein OA542_00185 [Opitutae bacterium]|nr:hypothetical protein [Opitutae bacterium]
MIDIFFESLKAGNPLYWGGFLVAIFFFFKFLQGLGKLVLLLLILAAIAYTVFYFNPEIFETLLKQAKDVTEEIDI